MFSFKSATNIFKKPVKKHVIKCVPAGEYYERWIYRNYACDEFELTQEEIFILIRLGYDFRYEK